MCMHSIEGLELTAILGWESSGLARPSPGCGCLVQGALGEGAARRGTKEGGTTTQTPRYRGVEVAPRSVYHRGSEKGTIRVFGFGVRFHVPFDSPLLCTVFVRLFEI